MSSKYRVTKGFKFHARPQTGAYSCLLLLCCVMYEWSSHPGERLILYRTHRPSHPIYSYTALSASPNLRAHRQYIHMCPTSSIDICWFFLTDRLVPTVPDRSGARVFFSSVVPNDHRVSLWHGISSVRCKTMFLLLVMVAQSHPATMTATLLC